MVLSTNTARKASASPMKILSRPFVLLRSFRVRITYNTIQQGKRRDDAMRDDLVLATMARRLRQEGLIWRPQVGDWCAILAAAQIAGTEAGIWLVIDAEAAGTLTVVDGAARWSGQRIVASEALWLPTGGQLKAWLRAQGYAVSTTEGAALSAATGASGTMPANASPAWASSLLGNRTPAAPAAPSILRFHCRAHRQGQPALHEADGMSEAEAVAEVVALVLASGEGISRRGG
jgi:hypothetical protein